MYISTLTNQPMDKIINWFMLLIIFVFDPLAIAMVVAANMAFDKIAKKRPDVEDIVTEDEIMEVLDEKIECSVPEGMEFEKLYPIEEEIIKEEPTPPKNTYVSSWGSPGGNRSK
jgi:hypothetical protein